MALSLVMFEPSAHRATGQPWMIGWTVCPIAWGPLWSAFPLSHLQSSLNAGSMPNPKAAAPVAAATLLLLALPAAILLLAPVARAQDSLQGTAAAPAAPDAGASRFGLAPGISAPAGELPPLGRPSGQHLRHYVLPPLLQFLSAHIYSPSPLFNCLSSAACCSRGASPEIPGCGHSRICRGTPHFLWRRHPGLRAGLPVPHFPGAARRSSGRMRKLRHGCL